MARKIGLALMAIILLGTMGIAVYWQSVRKITIRTPTADLNKKQEPKKDGGGVKKKIEEAVVPKVSLKSIDITDITKEKTSAVLLLNVYNPSEKEITLSKLQYHFYIKNQEIASGTPTQPITLKPKDSIIVKLPLSLNNTRTLKILKEERYKGNDQVDYELRASFLTDLPGLAGKEIAITAPFIGPLLKIPEATVTRIHVDKAGLRHIHVTASVTVDNPNSFPIKSKNIMYRLMINGDEVAHGAIPKKIDIPKMGKIAIAIPIDFKTGRGAKAIVNSIFKPAKEEYLLKMNMEAVFENGGSSSVKMQTSGTLKEIKDLKKEVEK